VQSLNALVKNRLIKSLPAPCYGQAALLCMKENAALKMPKSSTGLTRLVLLLIV